MPVDILYVQQV